MTTWLGQYSIETGTGPPLKTSLAIMKRTEPRQGWPFSKRSKGSALARARAGAFGPAEWCPRPSARALANSALSPPLVQAG